MSAIAAQMEELKGPNQCFCCTCTAKLVASLHADTMGPAGPLCRGTGRDVCCGVVHCSARCHIRLSVLTLRLAASALCLHCFSLSSRSALSFSAGRKQDSI